MAGHWSSLYGKNEPGVVDFEFSFLTNGSGAVDQASIRGKKVASVTRSTTGTYAVVLDGAYLQIQTAGASVFDDNAGAGGSASVYFADETVSPLAFTVFTKAANGTVSDLTARRVCVTLKLKVSAAR